MSLPRKWILLRGLGRSAGHWGSFRTQIEKAFPLEHFYFLDLQGNGKFNSYSSPIEIANYIAPLEQQLRDSNYFEIDGPTIGVGLSLGGMVLTEWSQQVAGRYQQIFLINSSGSNLSYPWQRLSLKVLALAIRSFWIKNRVEHEINSLLVTSSLTRDEILKKYSEELQNNVFVSEKFPIALNNVLRQAIAGARYSIPSKINTSATLIVGEKDAFVNADCSRAIQQKWNCKIEIHPTAGHDISFQDSAWLIRAISSNLQ